MASRKTWLWIILGGLGLCVMALFAIAGAGVYFVAQHFDTEPATGAEALRAFDDARARFKDAKPLFEIDERERPHLTRELSALPTSPSKPENLWIFAWDADEERTVKVSLPFWLLRLGRQKIDIGGGSLDFDRLNIDVRELERVGPLLLFDHRNATTGERVLVWTQ
jgi:hypothetical protein